MYTSLSDNTIVKIISLADEYLVKKGWQDIEEKLLVWLLSEWRKWPMTDEVATKKSHLLHGRQGIFP